ncbi:MAG: hypothetical protein ACRERV_08985, partial [Methylococcales bacterium]
MLITQPQFWLLFWPLLLLTSYCLARSSIETRHWFWILASLGLYCVADFSGLPWLLLSLSINAFIVAHLQRGWRGRK